MSHTKKDGMDFLSIVEPMSLDPIWMSSTTEGDGADPVGLSERPHSAARDQQSRFLEEGIWENGYEDKYLDKVKSIQGGDRIAIKATYDTQERLAAFGQPGPCRFSNEDQGNWHSQGERSATDAT